MWILARMKRRWRENIKISFAVNDGSLIANNELGSV
jgi:hypothetical protein